MWGKSTHQRPSVIIFFFFGVQEREKLDAITHFPHTPFRMNTNRSAVLNKHSQWLLGSSRRRWCSASGSSPRGQIWGWAQIQWAASPLLWWISSSSSWRSLQDSKWGTVTASIISKSKDGLPSTTSNGVSVAFVTLPCCFEDAALGAYLYCVFQWTIKRNQF